jgi:small conductance mechanosensitive channel
VKREFLRRLKVAFEKQGIETPFPRLTVFPGLHKDGSAPQFQVAGMSAK